MKDRIQIRRVCIFFWVPFLRRTLYCQVSVLRGKLPRGRKDLKTVSHVDQLNNLRLLNWGEKTLRSMKPSLNQMKDSLVKKRFTIYLVTARIEFLEVSRSQKCLSYIEFKQHCSSCPSPDENKQPRKATRPLLSEVLKQKQKEGQSVQGKSKHWGYIRLDYS